MRGTFHASRDSDRFQRPEPEPPGWRSRTVLVVPARPTGEVGHAQS